jgi:hypothetical protein
MVETLAEQDKNAAEGRCRSRKARCVDPEQRDPECLLKGR